MFTPLEVILIGGLVLGLAYMLWWFENTPPPEYVAQCAEEDRRERDKERLGRLADEFKIRKVVETPKVRERFANATVEGKRVAVVGDVVWWGRVDATVVLGAVKFDDGTYAAVGLEADGSFVFPKPSRFSWSLDNLTSIPRLELDDDHVAVWFAEERYIMAEHKYNLEIHKHRWEFTGIGSSGSVALREFAKRGMTFSAEEGPPTRH